MYWIKLLVLSILILSLLRDDIFVDGKSKKKKTKKKSKITNSILRPKPTTATAKVDLLTPPQAEEDNSLEYIPSDILDKLKNLNNIGDFIKEFKPAGVEQKGKVLKYITNGKTVLMDIPEKILPTECNPQLKIEKITVPGSFVYPKCEKVPRCGGCCVLPNQQCELVAFKTVTVPYFRIPHNGVARIDQRDSIHHTKCACKCRIKKEDCLPTQTFNEDDCQCDCKQKSKICGADKYWSNKYCGCKCALQPIKCGTWKKTWSNDECKCVCIKKPEACTNRGKTLDQSTCKCV